MHVRKGSCVAVAQVLLHLNHKMFLFQGLVGCFSLL